MDVSDLLHSRLAALGWDPRFAAAFSRDAAEDHLPARIVTEDRGSFGVLTGSEELRATVSGRLRFGLAADAGADRPAVGDWVAIQPTGDGTAVVRAVLPRRSAIVRQAPSDRGIEAQVVAANVDVAFLVTSLDRDFNLRRLERYLAVAWESGATPVVVLSKADAAADVDAARLAAASVAPGVEIIAVSAVTGTGLDVVRSHLAPGRTVVFVGSSGVGKSTLVNALAGAPILATAAVREDDQRGRHTTSRRQLVPLAEGLLIDTPGMRELGLHDADGLSSAFGDVDLAARTCRFRDCTHEREPGCGVRRAIDEGALDDTRFQAYRKLEREARNAEIRSDAMAMRAERKRWAAIHRSVSNQMRIKYGADR